MAFRFRREGDRIKHRVHMERMGMSPWIEDFKWRVIDWHYQFYMGPKARNAILSNQRHCKSIQDSFVPRGPQDGAYDASRTKHFAWTTYLPQVTPLRKTSNPFCPVTPNKTGWREYIEHKDIRGAVRPKSPAARQHKVQHTMDPKPKSAKMVVSGTDHTVPIFPKQD